MCECVVSRSTAFVRCGIVLVGLLLSTLPAPFAAAQQPPLESALSPEPEEPREALAPPELERGELALFGAHRALALVLAPIVEFGVENRLLGGGPGEVGGVKIKPGSLGPSSGVGIQLGYVYFGEPYWAGVSGGISHKGYQDHSAFIGVRDRSGASYLRATFGYDLDTQDEFSGLGMAQETSPEDSETDYRQEEIRLLGDAQAAPAELVRVGVRGGYRKNNILRGKNEDFPNITDVFGDSALAGVGILPGISGDEGKYAHGGAFLALDSRNDARNPDHGVLLGGSFDAFRGVAETPFDWNRWAGEFAGYLPVPDETRVFAVRLLAVHQDPLHGRALVPFYYLSSLGGSSFLRSFSSFRFQDNDLLYGAAEFRRRVWAEAAGQAALDASVFAESAGVYRDITEDAPLADMEQSFGTELRLLVPNDVIARLGVAVGSREGAKVYLGGGGRF